MQQRVVHVLAITLTAQGVGEQGEWCASQKVGERRKVFRLGHIVRLGVIADPSCERTAPEPDRLQAQSRMVEAPELESDHEDYRARERPGQIRHRLTLADRRVPAAGPFYKE